MGSSGATLLVLGFGEEVGTTAQGHRLLTWVSHRERLEGVGGGVCLELERHPLKGLHAWHSVCRLAAWWQVHVHSVLLVELRLGELSLSARPRARICRGLLHVHAPAGARFRGVRLCGDCYREEGYGGYRHLGSLDHRLPRRSGSEVARELRAVRHRLPPREEHKGAENHWSRHCADPCDRENIEDARSGAREVGHPRRRSGLANQCYLWHISHEHPTDVDGDTARVLRQRLPTDGGRRAACDGQGHERRPRVLGPGELGLH
mmetsp:Transcript_108855/g.314340  ORF Transcript_108855/g.314340 Transcript_108855/m.314340 type:complete len:262 (-) Transcript_108855:591-1376(-)